MASNLRPQFVPCASGTQPMTDVCVQVKGSLVELLAHPMTLLTPDDAMVLATAIIHAAQAAGWKDPRRDHEDL